MKNHKLLLIVGIIAFLGAFFIACEKPDQPTYGEDVPDPNPTGKPAAAIDSLSPDQGFLRDMVTIYGSGFDATAERNLVAFGNRTGTVVNATTNMLEVRSPNISGQTVEVKVAVAGSEFWSNIASFTFEDAVQVIDDEISWPNGVAADANGNVYIGSANDGVIYQIASDGTKSTFASVSVSGAIEFGPENYLYVCVQGEDKIVRISPDGSTIEDYVSVPSPIDFDWDSNGNMYIVENETGIHRRDNSGAVTYMTDLSTIKCIRVFDNYLYATAIWEGKITRYEITASGLGGEEIIMEEIDSPLAIEFDEEGTMYYTHAWETSLYTLAADGSQEVLYEGQLMTPMHYITFYGKTLYIVFPGWGDVGQTMLAYIGVNQAPNYGRP